MLTGILIGVSIGILIGGYVGHLITIRSVRKMYNEVEPTIEQAIDKETVKNEITNEIEIDKIKKSEHLEIQLDPTNNQEPINVVTKINPKRQKKKGFLGGLFKKKDKQQK